MTQTVLFLCTGNYYRSRFSEILFNYLAEQEGLDWSATSAGLWEGHNANPGPISIYTVLGLEDRNVPIDRKRQPNPRQVTEADFQAADLVIAVDEEEHRPMMAERFPVHENNITYWGVHDLHLTQAADALGTLEKRVNELISSLS